MTDMVLLKCDKGSKAAIVLCPNCGRISRQILKKAYENGKSVLLLSIHTCPVCGQKYQACNTNNAINWEAVFTRYKLNADSYNSAVKQDFSAKSSRAMQEKIVRSMPQITPEQETYYPKNQSNRTFGDGGKQDARDNPLRSTTEKSEQEAINTSRLSQQPNFIIVEPKEQTTGTEQKAGRTPDREELSKPIKVKEPEDPNISLLDRKINRWKKELLDTGKRNKMINYRETKRSTLKILEPGDKELFNLLAISEKTLTFQRPISKDSDFRTYAMLALLETLSYSLPVHVGDIKAEGTVMEREKTLRNLRSKTKLAQEEQGTNILYLSFGFIIWRENNRASSPWLKSPLLMMPVQLGIKSLNAPYTLSKYDDEIEVNPTLDYLFNQNYGIDLPTFELKNKDSFENYLETVEEIVDKKGWKLVREVSLGLLSFLKISMYHDLNDNREQMINNPVIKAISGDRYVLGDLPAQARDFNFDKTQPTEWHEVVDSDSSQEEAILLSKLGVSFVMQGPPGTGKSQTITNIIAEALGDGKKVLFVSEKSAALQVVLKRLTEARLDDFCLSLHNYKANKKEIIDNIGANLSLSRGYIESSVMAELTELFHDRQYLDEYAEELHKRIEPFGESVYMVFGKLAKLSDATAVDFKLENPTKITKEQYLSLLYVIDAFEKALHNIEGKLSDNPWADTAATSSGQVFKTEMVTETEGLSGDLNELETLVFSFNNEYNTCIGTTWNTSSQDIGEMDKLFTLPLFPINWRNAEHRKMLRERAIREEKKDQAEQGHARKLAELVKKIESEWTISSLGFSGKRLSDEFSDSSLWIGSDKSENMAECNNATIKALEEIYNEIEEIAGNYEKAKSLLRISQKDHPESILMVSRLLHILSDAPDMNPGWFDIRKNKEFIIQIEEIKIHKEEVNQKTDQLLKAWEPAVLDIDAGGMLARFKTEYTGMFHKMKGTYKEDMKQIKLLSKTVGLQIGEPEVIALLQEVQEYNAKKKWFIDNEARLEAEFPDHYQGMDTDCDKILVGIKTAAEVSNQFPYANIPEEVIEAIQELGTSIQKAADVRRLADVLKEETVNGCLDALLARRLITSKNEEVSLSETLLAKIREQIDREKSYREIIGQLNAARKEGYTSFTTMIALISDMEIIRQESIWFKENIPDIVKELDIVSVSEDEPICKEIVDAELILKNHDAIAEKDETEELTSLFGHRYTGNYTDWHGVIRDIDAVEMFEKEFFSDNLKGFIKATCDDEAGREQAKKKVERFKSLYASTEPKFVYFDGLFPKSDMKEKPLHDVATKYDTCLNGFSELNKWVDYVETKADCDKYGLSGFTEKIAWQNNSVKDVRKAFERGFYTQWLGLVVNDVPSVQTFRRRVHEQRLGKFINLDEKQFEYSKDRIRDSIIRTFPDRNAVTSARSELRTLQHEMEKKRRIMPLRKLFHEIPTLLLTLKPCLMMSPLSVAYFLNAEDYHFDMVIFDEASQIFPQDAIGAIFRADQVIIAGDTRQLPPTNFFSTSTSNASDDYDDDNEEDYEEVYDSILEETANVLPNRTLLWHYRSKHEHLIAFSNQEIYKNELVTFPSSNENEPDTGVEFSYVEGGYYDRGGKRNNVLEAKRCVELVKEHIEKHPQRSLGIIALSEAQQQTILNEIQKFREENPKYENFFREDKEEEFFVKNLENVQGDERDTIFLSICYAKTKEQIANNKPMSLNFGPVMKAGGERRLNVAVTRAKLNVKLISSILPSDIDLSRTESDGIRMIRSYIEFAMNGGATLASENQNRVPDDFVNAVYKYICDKGYKARQYVGCSDYRIDIAIEHPELPEEFVAGIECDGISYVSAKTARDRDRLRGSVLQNMGWNLYRVWSTEWYRNPEIEGQKLVEFIDKAIEKSNERLKAIQEQKEAEERKRQDQAEKERLEKEREEKRRLLEEQRLAEAERAKAEQAAEKRRKAAEERRRAEEKRQEVARLKAQQEAAERRRQGELRKQQERQAAMNQVSWAKPGVKVKHDSFGVGTIKSIETDKIIVSFSTGEKRFAMPNAFVAGYLKKVENSGVNTNGRDANNEGTIENTHKGLYKDLVTAGFTCIDNRASSSIIWVIYKSEKKELFEQIVSKYSAKYWLEKRGAMATGSRAAWRIMT